MNQLVKRFDEFGKDFNIVAIFDSAFDNLVRHAKGHKVPFSILADEWDHLPFDKVKFFP